MSKGRAELLEIPPIRRDEVHALINRFIAQELANYPPDQETQRKRAEIEFNRIYATCFHHGTDGHNLRLISAEQEERLDKWLPETIKE